MSQEHIEKKVVQVPDYAWVILAGSFIASVAAPLNQFKVSPVMPVLMEAFNLTLTSAGMLMSVFAITGFILALPGGLILQRLGLKITGLIAIRSFFWFFQHGFNFDEHLLSHLLIHCARLHDGSCSLHDQYHHESGNFCRPISRNFLR